MSARKEVNAVLDRLRSRGLEVRKETGLGHWKVHDPASGAWLFNVSSSPSDTNWVYNIQRHMRRLGIPWESKGRRKYRGGGVDLEALAAAQRAAAANGERVPQLTDLEDMPSVRRMKEENVSNKGGTPKVSSSAVALLRARLVKFMKDRSGELERRASERNRAEGGRSLGAGRGANTEFVRVAMEEVGPAKGLRVWKSIDSGQNTVGYLLSGKQTGLSEWVYDLLVATLDKLEGTPVIGPAEGAQAVIPEAKAVSVAPESQFPTAPPPAPAVPEYSVEDRLRDEISKLREELGDALKSIEELTLARSLEAEAAAVASTTNGVVKEEYAKQLLAVLAAEGSATQETILSRLDRLAGIGAE